MQRTAIIGLKRFQMARVVEMKGTKLKGTLPSAFSIGYCNVCTNQPTTLGVCTLCRHSAPFLSYQNLALLLRKIVSKLRPTYKFWEALSWFMTMIHFVVGRYNVKCEHWFPPCNSVKGLIFYCLDIWDDFFAFWFFADAPSALFCSLVGERERDICHKFKLYIYIYYKSSRPDSRATMTLSP